MDVGAMHDTYVYYYTFLNEDERGAYGEILAALRSHRKTCSLSQGVEVDSVEKVLECIRLENPLIGYFENYVMHHVRGRVRELEFQYLLPADKQEAVERDLLRQASKIAEYARKTSGEARGQVVAVHDYFVRQQYDHQFHSYAFTPAGSLLYGTTVCMGVALAFKLVMDMLDIASICVKGEHDGEGHAWNKVFYDNSWHFADVTFDMCLSDEGRVSYKYFSPPSVPREYRCWDAFPVPN